jgi:hypothetical protein
VSDFAYELTASKTLDDTSLAAKKAAVDATLDLLVAQFEAKGPAEVLVGQAGFLGDATDRLPFPVVDFDMDGVPDEAGKSIEVQFPNDPVLMVKAGLGRAIALPWAIAAYTQGDTLNVVFGVPETFTRVYFRGAKRMKSLQRKAERRHKRLRRVVNRALRKSGYATNLETGLPGSEMTESKIAQIESMLGPITDQSIAPSVRLSGVTVEQVTAALDVAFHRPHVADLTGDGVVDEQDHALLPSKFQAYIMSGGTNPTFEQMACMMQGAVPLWEQGLTFQQWRAPRVLDQSSEQVGELYQIELCQSFYAASALSTGYHHMPAMPCAIDVWQEGDEVVVNILHPAFIFGYFFQDALPQMPPFMQQLFSIFPTMVYNEMAALANAGLADLGQTTRFALQDLPVEVNCQP